MQSGVNRLKDLKSTKAKAKRRGREKCKKNNWKKCKEKNAETTVSENHDRENESEKKNKKK